MKKQKPINSVSKVATKLLPLSAPVFWVRELGAILVWVGVFAHLFIFNLGTFATRYFPSLSTFLPYRFLVFLGIISFFWLMLGNRLFLRFFGYTFFYPFLFILWKIPRRAFLNWPILIAFFPAIHSAFSMFRVNFILFSLFLISSFVIALASNATLEIICMAIVAFYLVLHYFQRFRVAYSPSTIFATIGTIVGDLWNNFEASGLIEKTQELDPEAEDYKENLGKNLLSIYMLSTLLYYLGERLREVVEKRMLDLYLLVSLMRTFILTTLVFGIEYLGLERVMPGSFANAAQPTFLKFLGYSFCTLMTSDISPIKAESGTAQLITYVQLFCSLLIVVLLVFVILTSIRERYQKDLDNIIYKLGTTSENIGGFLEANYNLTHIGLEAFLLETIPQSLKYILRLRYGEQREREILESVKD